MDRVEQGQPELLGVLLIALHLHDRKPMRLDRTVGPGAQQRRLPAAGRSRDDRHLLGRRAIKGSEKITPVDQPESCPSHQASVCTGNNRAEPRFCSALMRAPSARSIPSWPNGGGTGAGYLMMRPPSAHRTWPVIAAAMSEAK